MRKKKRRSKIERFKESVMAQLLTAYGIMLTTTVISFFLLDSRAKRLGNFTSAIVPTTITFFATALYEYEYVHRDKIQHAWYVLLTVLNSLLYAAFLCVDITANDRVMGLALLACAATFVSLGKLWHDVRLLSDSPNIATADGSISGNRR